jgi:BlaI family penicillinase repressor
MSRHTPRLGKVQTQIMDVLWRRGTATARQITEDLCSEGPPIAHSTVQTLLRKLEAKGAVAHDMDERVFIFRPMFRKEEVAETATHDFLARIFQGSAYSLVSHLISNERISTEELTHLREMIDRRQDREESA